MRKKKKRPVSVQPPAGKPLSRDRRIVVVDPTPLRRGIMADCRKHMASLEGARAQVRQFETGSRPAFARWMAKTFGPLLTQQRELIEAIQRADELIDEVHLFALIHGGSLRVAYHRVMQERERPFAASAEPEIDDRDDGEATNEDAEDAMPSDDQINRELFEESLRLFMGVDPRRLPADEYQRMYRDFLKVSGLGDQGKPPPKHHRFRGGENQNGGEDVRRELPSASAPGRIKPRLKELYRALVRRLHPDMRADADTEVSALWHEVQAAYQRGDEERLETLLALCDVQADAVSNETSLSQLRAVAAELKRSLNAIRRALGQMRKDPAWDFEKQNLPQLRRTIQHTLEMEIETLRFDLAEAELEIERWKRPAPSGRKKKVAAKKVSRSAVEPMRQGEFGF